MALKKEHKASNGFKYSERFLDHSQNFNMICGNKISALLHKSWEKSFFSRIVVPAKMSFCNDCSEETCYNRCNIQIMKRKNSKLI